MDKKSRELSYVPTGPSFFKKGKILAYSKLTSTFHSQIRLNQIRSAKCIYLTALATWQPKVKKYCYKKMFFEANGYSKTPYSNNQRPFFSMRTAGHYRGVESRC